MNCTNCNTKTVKIQVFKCPKCFKVLIPLDEAEKVQNACAQIIDKRN